MKHGKKPTREQRKLLLQWRTDPAVWLIVKDTPEYMEICHRDFETTRKRIPKGGRSDG